MRIKYLIFSKFLLLMLGAVTATTTDDFDLDNKNALKQLLHNTEKPNIKIEECDNIVQFKDARIMELESKLADLQLKVSLFNMLETVYIEQSKNKDDIIAVLKQKIGEMEDIIAMLEKKIRETQQFPKNCVPFENSTGIHEITMRDLGKFQVLCDGLTAGNGWTVVQRRFDGSENFYRNWSEYRNGFGNLQGEFFMGLEKLHKMTTSEPYELYIELVDFKGEVRNARYDSFFIGSEDEAYMLKSLGAYSGSAGNALNYNLHDKFTTYDQDNDGWPGGNCARYYSSGWWYNLYGNSNLNGKYFDSQVNHHESIWWYNWKGYTGLKSVKMMIRPRYLPI